jgi:hypothetical protein
MFILYIRTKKQMCTQIMLEITTGSECVTLPVMNLPLCLSCFTIDAPDDIFNVELSNFTKIKLFVQWPGFVITNSLTNQSMHVKQEVDIGSFDLRKINKMLQQPFMAYILIVHQGVAIPLPVQNVKNQ